MAKKIDAAQFKLYKNYQTIPLHRPDDSRTLTDRTGKTKTVRTGKRPLDKNWTTRQYSTPSVIARCEREQRNMGVRLRTTDLVIDVDPRNGGDEGFADFCLDCGLSTDAFPVVVTGSGGLHVYGKKPAGLAVVDTLPAYPGVEFKSKGRQVVSAGSVHPDTGKLYNLDPEHPPLDDAPEFPKIVLRMLQRPQRMNKVKGGGQYSQEQIARALDKLDPEEFREHDEWLKLMMAVHHASNGDARDEWVEWSTSDPQYADDGEMIGRRWDSLHAERNDGITYQTLNWILTEHGAQEGLVADSAAAADDFDDGEDYVSASPKKPKPKTKAAKRDEFEGGPDDDDEFEGDAGGDEDDEFEGSSDGIEAKEKYDEEAKGWLAQLNERFMAVLEGGKFRVIEKNYDQQMKRNIWTRIGRQDFESYFMDKLVYVQDPAKPDNPDAVKAMTLGAAWLKWPHSRRADGVVFDPTQVSDDGMIEAPDGRRLLNFFEGWKDQPDKRGEWSYLKEMVFEVLCKGNQVYFDYLMNWAADMFQNPARPAEVATVFRGGQGVGKGTWGNTLARLCGQHGMAIRSPEMLVGRFNAHMQDLIFLFADEAVRPYDKVAEGKLNGLITEHTLTIEGKGRDAITAPNYLHIMMASNDQWVVPASADARRFFMLEASTKYQGQFGFWEKLNTQLRSNDDSGYKALLHDLLNWPIPDNWHPARNMPKTDALTDQKLNSLKPLQQFFFDALLEGVFPFEHFGDWTNGEIWFFRQDLRDAFDLYCQKLDIRFQRAERGSAYFLMRDLLDIFPGVPTELTRKPPEGERPDLKVRPDGRAKAVLMPKLATCRKMFETCIKGTVHWTAPKENWE